MSAPQLTEKQKMRGTFAVQAIGTLFTMPGMGPPVPCIQCIAWIQSTFSIYVPCTWLKWDGLHDRLEPAEGLPGVAGAASAIEIFGTNPKNLGIAGLEWENQKPELA